MGSPRSGTHALGSVISKQLGFINLGEICQVDGATNAVEDIERILDTRQQKVAHIVQMLSKVQLSGKVSSIKKSCEIILLRRRNKLLQFASWMYFHKSGGVLRDWHNHVLDTTAIGVGELCVTQNDIEQFLLEQMLDDFFCPDKIMYYEDIDFSSAEYQKNHYTQDITSIFSNLDFVKKHLADWNYYEPMAHG